MSNAELFKVSHLGTGVLPLLPDQTLKSPDNPGFQRLENVSGFDQAEVVPPSPKIHIQLFDNLVKALPAVAVGHSSRTRRACRKSKHIFHLL